MAHAVCRVRLDRDRPLRQCDRTHGTDEAGQVLSALEQMQAKLAELKEQEANVAATVGGRIRAALDHATSSMLVADSN